MDSKVCRLCPELGPQLLDNFGKSSKNKDGFDNRCKACRARIYSESREKAKEKAKDAYWRNVDDRRRQKVSYYGSNRDDILESRRNLWSSDPSRKEKRDAYWKKRKSECFQKLGGVCRLCGTRDPDVLTVDHVNDDGNEERRSNPSNLKIWNNIVHGDKVGRYQLLCFNCNVKKSLLRPDPPPIGSSKRCPTCLLNNDVSLFKVDRSYKDGFYYECKPCSRKRGVATKQIAFLQLGHDSCSACSADDLDVLTVDHVHGDGGACRKADGLGLSLYRKVISGLLDRTRFQVLCFNCNVKKHVGTLSPIKAPRPAPVPAPVPDRPDPSLSPSLTLDFPFPDLDFIVAEENRDAIRFMEAHHYGGYGRHGTVIYEARLGGELLAVMKLASPVRKEVASSMGMEYSKVFELDRFCIHPNRRKKNFGSFLLSRLVKAVRKDFPDNVALVSFSDPGYGHDGTVYRAANWEYVGGTSRGYEYVARDGSVLHKKTVYNAARARGMKERDYSDFIGLVRRYTVRKLKFVYRL